jgi:hypothetical protein
MAMAEQRLPGVLDALREVDPSEEAQHLCD